MLGKSSLWVHPNEKLIGIDFPKAMRKAFGKGYNRWQRVYKEAYEGKESRGYYFRKDADGRLREKFMVCMPVEGSPYVIASTTYLDEYTWPVKEIEKHAEKLVAQRRNMVFGLFIVTIILIGLIVFLYGQRITGKIKSLTDVADRISAGKLDSKIGIESNDEIGDLGYALSGMQQNIRLSIERAGRRSQIRRRR